MFKVDGGLFCWLCVWFMLVNGKAGETPAPRCGRNGVLGARIAVGKGLMVC